MNTKSSMKSLLYRAGSVFMIATMLFAAIPVNPINAAAVTYNFQPDTGTTVATGVVTNDAACATNSTVSTTTLMSTAALSCPLHVIRPLTSGAQNILDVWFNTAYALDTTVTGTSLKIRLRELSGEGGGTSWTAGIMLMYVNASGTITNFTGTEVTQVVADNSDADYTISLADQSATIPAGSKLGIRIRATDGTSTSMRVYYGNTASTISGTSGVLIVDEKQTTILTVAAATGTYAGTTDLSATLTNSTGSPTSGKTISFTLNGSIVGSVATDASGVASLTGISLAGIDAGNYPTGVAASFAGDTDYVTSNGTNSLDVSKATPTLSVTNSPVTYNGSPQAATVVGSVAGVVSDIQYDGSATVPTNATTYTVTADFVPTDTTNYNSLTDASAGNFVIDKATPTLSVTNSPVG
ncbi:MAG: MBG domain-containing protein, partial [Chloroflexota bacterium]|nr:MBG domain-containing protein [Chloroflexota bacterium]